MNSKTEIICELSEWSRKIYSVNEACLPLHGVEVLHHVVLHGLGSLAVHSLRVHSVHAWLCWVDCAEIRVTAKNTSRVGWNSSKLLRVHVLLSRLGEILRHLVVGPTIICHVLSILIVHHPRHGVEAGLHVHHAWESADARHHSWKILLTVVGHPYKKC